MTKEERDSLLEQREKGESWNAYKSAGSHLLANGRITPEEYHNHVRSYGIEMNSIEPNAVPESIDDDIGKKLGFEIGGAVVGSLLFGGARLVHPLGWLGYVAQQSIASGAGAAVGNAAYFRLMSAPEYSTQQGFSDSMEVGKDVAKFNAAFMGGLKVGGPLIKATALGGLGLTKWTAGTAYGAARALPVTGYALKKAEGGFRNFKDYAGKYILGKNEMANAIVKTAEERGIVLSKGMLLSPVIRSILEAFSRTPVIGTPIRESYEKTIKSVANSLVDDVQKGATIEQAASKFSNRFKFDEKTGRYVLDDAGGYSPDSINFEAIVGVLNRADGYEKQIGEGMAGLFGTFTKLGKRSPGSLTGDLGVYAPNISYGALKQWWKNLGERGLQGEFHPEFSTLLNKIARNEKLSPYQMKNLYQGMDRTERHLLNRIQSPHSDELYINFDDARSAFTRDVATGLQRAGVSKDIQAKIFEKLNTHQGIRKNQLDFLDKADQTGIMSATNMVFREGGKMVERINTAMRDSYMVKSGGKTYSEMMRSAQDGNFFKLPGSTTEAAKRAAGRFEKQDYETIMRELFINGKQSQHANLMELIGTKSYGKLAQNELDNLFDSTIIKYLNDGGGPGRLDFLTKIGAAGSATEAKIAKDRVELLLTNLNKLRVKQNISMLDGKVVPFGTAGAKTTNLKPITYKQLKDYGELLQFLPERPSLNQFIQRSLALKLAGGISAASVTGFVGIGGAAATGGGPIAGIGAVLGFRVLAKLLSSPAQYDDFANLLSKSQSNPEMRAKALEQIDRVTSRGNSVIDSLFSKAVTDGDTTLIRGLVAVGAVTQKEADSMLNKILEGKNR